MKHTQNRIGLMLAIASISSILIIEGCSKKEQVSTTDSSAVTSTPAPSAAPVAAPADTMSGHSNMPGMTMKPSGRIDADMEAMGKMMVEKLGPADANYDDRFIQMMIPHHKGAVMMASDALSKTSKPELKQLAQKIVSAQNSEIAQMEQWDQKWYGHSVPTDNAMHMMNLQMVQELGPSGQNYEHNFIDGMIPHHESAIAMAKDALQKSTHPEIKQLAQNIITSQQKEIDELKTMRKQWYGH